MSAKRVTPDLEGPRYERDPLFDAYVDDDYGTLVVQDVAIRPCDALWTDPAAYNAARMQWVFDKQEELKRRVVESFPYPIASSYALFLDGSDSANQRWQFLKDTWEALISVLMALVACEVRDQGTVLVDTAIRREWLQSQTVRERIEVIRLCREKEPAALTSTRLIADGVIEKMIVLNERRNEDFSHRGTLNERQLDELINDAHPALLGIFEGVEWLADVALVRPVDLRKEELFAGDNSRRRIRESLLSADEKVKLAARPGFEREVFARLDGRIYSLSPYIICRPSERGHRTELAYFKKKVGAGPDRVLVYEVFGEAEPLRISDQNHLSDLDSIRAMFTASSTGKR